MTNSTTNRRRTCILLVIVAAISVFLIYFSMSSSNSHGVIYPEPLKPGDKIAIVSPAGPIDTAVVMKADSVLRELGFTPVIYPNAFNRNGYFAGTHDERFADLKAAFTDPEVRAILCSRGGYGVVHNLDRLSTLLLAEDPKWVIGFSDISALHALMATNNVASIHASMAKHIALGPEDPDNAALFSILRGEELTYKFASHPYNHIGKAEGRLLGGNLAVIAELINTPFDVIKPGTILFIEDVSEPVYKIERIMYQLKLSGVLGKLKGLIVGQFTDYKPDACHESMEAMIRDVVAPYNIPVAFDLPIGHVSHNVPVVVSCNATLEITPTCVTLTQGR